MTLHVDQLIGSRIRQYRLTRGMSQTDLGNKLKLSPQQVQKYEAGTSALASSRVRDVCRSLQITPNMLFDQDTTEIDETVAAMDRWQMAMVLRIMRVRRDQRPIAWQVIEALVAGAELAAGRDRGVASGADQ
jgi:transcriptional regulator with XRE-family HTH domain